MPVGDIGMCTKNVLYIGSSVPLETSEGLDAIQQPLKEHYPVEDGATIDGMKSTLTVSSTGLQLLFNDDDSRTTIWFPIESLTLCAAVRCINTYNTASGEKVAKFVSLSSPAAGGQNARRPAIFTAITRRTKGKKVLECHGFVCECARDAMDLVKQTSVADKMNKARMNGPLMNTANMSVDASSDQLVHPLHKAEDTNTFRRTTELTNDFPVRLIPGEGGNVTNGVAPEFLKNPPEHGYFYSTKSSKVKKYTVDPVSDAEVDYLNATSPPPLFARPAGDRRSVYSQPPAALPVVHAGASMTLPHPRPAQIIPVRSMAPSLHSVITPPPAIISPPPQIISRRRFFSPPPAQVVRPRIIPGVPRHDPHVFMPPQPVFVEAPYVIKRRQQRRGSHSSGSDSSSRSSSPRNLHDETFPKRHDNGDLSSELSSRPRTPPTDYDVRPRGHRVSRRDDYDLRHRHMATIPINGPNHPVHPNYYVIGGPQRLAFFPRPNDRPRSVPPTGDKKGKKGKNKKKDKKSKKRVYGIPSDSADSFSGYMSENPNLLDRSYPRLPKDMGRREMSMREHDMNMSERAFSKNLEAQSRASLNEPGMSAYTLNDHMASRAKNGDDFNMY